ncbi:MAG: YfhO family protein [Myxococcaceae bacterium]|nr:YfhO family protein [Myxococcaceae bacterium]
MTRRSLGWLAALLVALLALYTPLLFGRALAGRDAFRLFIPDTAFLFDALRALDWPLWNPWQRLGQPFAATLQSQAFYPVRWLAMLSGSAVRAVSVEQALHAAIAALGAFRFARALGRSRWASSLAGAAFGLSPLFTQLGIQQNVASTAAWAGWIGAAACGLRARPGRRAAAGLAATLALGFLGGSPETLVWALVLVAVLLARNARARWWALASGGLFVALAGITLVPTIEFTLASQRASGGELDPLAWSAPPISLLAMGWLNADLPRPEYWGGEQNFLPTVFIGTVIVALAALGATKRRARAMTGFGLGWALVSLGAHFAPARWLLSLPPLSLFRYPAKYLVAVALAGAVLAAFGFDGLVARARGARPPRATVLRALAFLLGLVGLAFVVLAAGVVRPGAAGGLGLGLAMGLLAFAGWFAAAPPRRSHKVRITLAAAALVELGAANALLGHPLWRDANALEASSPLAAAMGAGFTGRISVKLPAPERDSAAYIDASRPALVPLRFVEEHVRAVEGYGAPEPLRVDDVFSRGGRAAFDLAGVAFYVRDGEAPFSDLEPVTTALDAPRLYRSRTALPRAFVVHDAESVTDETARQTLLGDRYDYQSRVQLLGPAAPRVEAAGCSERAATIVRDEPRRVVVEVRSCRSGFLVLTDAWYPGWSANVDGADTPILRANHLVRAVAIAPGTHVVEFSYLPTSFLVGAALTMLGLLGLGLALRPRTGPARREDR